MKKLLLVGAVMLTALSSASAESLLVKAKSLDGHPMDAVAGQIVVKYRHGRSAAARSRLRKTFAAQSFRINNSLESEVLKVPAGETIESYIDKLKDDPDVEFAEPNGIARASTFVPNDPQLGNQYYLSKISMYAAGSSSAAWDVTQGSDTVVVADLDTGALLNQAEYTGQLDKAVGTTIGIDWNLNGNFTDQGTCASNCVGNDQAAGNPPMDDNYSECDPTFCTDVGSSLYHGTRTSSVIGAAANNAVGMAGIAPNVKLLIVKVLGNKGSGPFDAIANGITWATDNGAKVINMSLGASNSSALLNAAVQYALNHDVVVVAAAGNEAPCSVEYPGAINGVIAVGATTNSDTIASFSCGGSALDLVAPGVGIVTLSSNTTPIYSAADGTSFSSPMVAAAAALIRSIAPNLSYTQVTQYIDNFTDFVPGQTSFNTTYGYGRLNVYKALLAVQGQTVITSDRAAPGKTFPAPNPYNPAAGQPVHFRFPGALGNPTAANPLGFELRVYDIAGETVKKLDSSCLDSQSQCSWDGRNDSGSFIASGFYLYHVKTSEGSLTGKLTVLK